jgi:ADP-heptose:LPS heptosyltransferase
VRIRIIRDDNIGDAILFSGALPLLRARWPEATIELVVRRHVCSLFRYCPYIDRLGSYESYTPWESMQKRGIRGAWALESILRMMTRFRMRPDDVLLCPVSAPREEYVSLVGCLRAEEKIGFSGYMFQYESGALPSMSPEAVYTRSVVCSQDTRWMHEFERLRDWLACCGCSDFVLPLPKLWLSERDHETACCALPHKGSYIGVFLGASSHWRRWPTEKWYQLLSTLTPKARLVLLGGVDVMKESSALSTRLQRDGRSVMDLCGVTGIRELAACINRCGCLISTESAGLHFAIAQDVPTVGIVGHHHMGRYVPWGAMDRHRIACVDCAKSDSCTGACFYQDYRCIQDIPVNVVRRELDELFRVISI